MGSVPVIPGAITEPVYYKGKKLEASARAGFICLKGLVVELKASAELTGADESRFVSHLQTTGHDTGLLLNFGASSLEYRRLTTQRAEPDNQNPNWWMETL